MKGNLPISRVNITNNDAESELIHRDEYDGIYRSADDSLFLGVCGGMAHKLKMDLNSLRWITAFLLGVTNYGIVLYVLVGLILPKRSTREEEVGAPDSPTKPNQARITIGGREVRFRYIVGVAAGGFFGGFARAFASDLGELMF